MTYNVHVFHGIMIIMMMMSVLLLVKDDMNGVLSSCRFWKSLEHVAVMLVWYFGRARVAFLEWKPRIHSARSRARQGRRTRTARADVT
jgi:hypothetical protein